MRAIEKNTIESSELVEQTFAFWFNDNGHIRSPFPGHMRSQLKVLATEKFFDWTKNLKEEAKDELNDEIVGEKFEEIIFETAIGLVRTEDERITILYPFLPRLGDLLNDQNGLQSSVVDRAIMKEDGISYLKVSCQNDAGGEKWQTKFELPL